ncbi:MAG: exonuclease SbcCD subunit D [Thermomicrobiales bacterium]|nr:exonuclease SbcCD subunit D [Thermomicrobiales bacterium]MCO5217537.1 exonuclease SbcCD subunit D [Thermomicrobiales bacterium]MCO5226033.1 exonuclease SbcCD subunit D [Thermomicrobiales bacterium]MCO5226989.1 exonuclease SbcCD subunit D [Thermomicrobiales bacterium]
MSRPIRIAHITDTHLGYRTLNKPDPASGRNQRTVDFERAFEWAVNDIIEQEKKPDAVIHAGDVFHHARPTWQSMRHFIQQWQKIERAGIPSLVIAGNHDTPRVRTGGSAYSILELVLPNTTFYAGYEDKHDHETFQHLGIHVHAVPHGALTSDNPVVPQVFANRINVMVIHGMVKGILKPGQHAEPGEEELDTSLLDHGFDYIALGHYHQRMQPPGIGNGWYAGSTERNGWGDYETQPGYLMVTLNGPGEGFDEPEVHKIPEDIVRPMIDLKATHAENMRGPEIAEEVLRKINSLKENEETRQRAMVRARIWDAERGDRREAESILKREAADLVWHLSVPTEASGNANTGERPEVAQEFPDIRELFGQFVESRTGIAFNDRFAQIFRERGDATLAEAIAAAVTVAPEEDELT